MKRPTDHNRPASLAALILCAALFAVIFFLLVAIVGASQQYGLFELLSAATKQLYLMHYSNFNEFRSGSLDGTNVMVALQEIILAAAVTTVLIVAFFCGLFAPKWRLDIRQAISVSWITALIIFSACLQLKRIESFILERKQFAGQDLKHRIASIMGTTFTFSDACNAKLKKPVNVEFLTDADMTKDPYMTNQRGLAYYLYPKISLRLPTDGDVDGKLYFYKENVFSAIPPEYGIVCKTPQMEYVLTVKRAKWDDYVNN